MKNKIFYQVKPDVFYKIERGDGIIEAFAVELYCKYEHALLNGPKSDFTVRRYENESFENMIEISKKEYERIYEEVDRFRNIYQVAV